MLARSRTRPDLAADERDRVDAEDLGDRAGAVVVEVVGAYEDVRALPEHVLRPRLVAQQVGHGLGLMSPLRGADQSRSWKAERGTFVEDPSNQGELGGAIEPPALHVRVVPGLQLELRATPSRPSRRCRSHAVVRDGRRGASRIDDVHRAVALVEAFDEKGMSDA